MKCYFFVIKISIKISETISSDVNLDAYIFAAQILVYILYKL